MPQIRGLMTDSLKDSEFFESGNNIIPKICDLLLLLYSAGHFRMDTRKMLNMKNNINANWTPMFYLVNAKINMDFIHSS